MADAHKSPRAAITLEIKTKLNQSLAMLYDYQQKCS